MTLYNYFRHFLLLFIAINPNKNTALLINPLKILGIIINYTYCLFRLLFINMRTLLLIYQ